MRQREISDEIIFLIKCFTYFAPVCVELKEDRRSVKVRKFRSAIILLFLINLTIVDTYLLVTARLLESKINTIRGVVEFSIIFSVILKYLATIYLCLVHQNDIVRLWNQMLNINCMCRQFKFKCITNCKMLMILVITINGLELIFTLVTLFHRMVFSYDIIVLNVLSVCTTTTMTTLTMSKYTTFLTLLTNYFKQLNTELKVMLKTQNKDMMERLKQFALIHQKFCELIKQTITLFGPQLIVVIAQSIICLTGYVYILFHELLACCNYAAIGIVLYLIIEIIATMALILTPSELCMKHVRMI